MYTSGTTGMPKGCIIDNEYFFFAAERYLAAGGTMTIVLVASGSTTRCRRSTPMAWPSPIRAMILSRNCMIFPDRFHPGSWWHRISSPRRRRWCTTWASSHPRRWRARQKPAEREHTVRFGVGAGVDPALRVAFENSASA